MSILRPLSQQSRIPAQADLGPQTRLSRHLPYWVRPETLSTRAADLNETRRITLVLRRDTQVQAAFEKLLADQQDPASPLYHQWLTPQQVGELYGPTQADFETVTAWAATQGLRLESAAPSRLLLEFSAPMARLAAAFRTSFSYYALAGTPRLAADTEPSVPTALLPVIAMIGGLSEPIEGPTGHSASVDLGDGSEQAQGTSPQYSTSTGSHYVTPADFATIFDVNSVYASGNTGQTVGSKSQHIAIIDSGDALAQDIADYAAKVGIASYTLNIIQAGATDPGITAGESTEDLDRTVGGAPGAVSDLIVVGNANGGIFTAASYNVNILVDPVMTISYGGCEAANGLSYVTKWDTLFAAAAAEGISVFVSAGDSGVAGCDTHGAAPTATAPLPSINGICASTYATCVGGTEFADTANPSFYWLSINVTGRASALSYIPEGVWNEPTTTGAATIIDAGGGGPSVYVTKPSWQTGTGVPVDGFRDTPDISFPASAHDGYYGCQNLNCENGTSFEYFYGTSAAAPAMAAIAALLNTKAGVAQGNLNPLIYRLAASASANNAFHDTTIASSGVTPCTPIVPSLCNNSVPSLTALTGGLAGYTLTTGYDLASGWGSLDVANFMAAAVPVAFSLAAAPTMLNFTSGATIGNTSTVTIASVNAFAGNVALSCSISTSAASAQPTCTVSPLSITLASGSSGTAVVTISSTIAHAALERPSMPLPWKGMGLGGSSAMAMLFCFTPRRRRAGRWLAMATLAALSAASFTGCGGNSGSSSSATAPLTLKSSAGSYTVTILGTSTGNGSTGSATASTAFSVVIN